MPDLFSDQCEYIEIPSGRTWNTPDAILGYAEATLSGIPDCHTKIVSVVANENMAAVEWIMAGTNTDYLLVDGLDGWIDFSLLLIILVFTDKYYIIMSY